MLQIYTDQEKMFGEEKIAICISGLTRTGIEAAASFKTFFQGYQHDVFFHTWYESDEINKKLVNLYKPKKFLIEQPLEKDPSHVTKGSFESMFFSIMRANDLKKDHEIENGFRYDAVVRHRFDVVFDPESRFHFFEKRKRTIYSHTITDEHVNVDFHHRGINDLFFYGDSESMDIACNSFKIYSSTWDKIRKEISIGIAIDCGDAFLSPGQTIYKIASDRNIRSERISGPMTQYPPAIWRPWVKDLDPIKDFDSIKKSRYQW